MQLIEIAKVVKNITKELNSEYESINISYRVTSKDGEHLISQVVINADSEEEKIFDVSNGHFGSMNTLFEDARQVYEILMKKFSDHQFAKKKEELPLYVDFDKLTEVVDLIEAILENAMQLRAESALQIKDKLENQIDFLFRLTFSKKHNIKVRATMYSLILEVVEAPKGYSFPDSKASHKTDTLLQFPFVVLQDVDGKASSIEEDMISMMVEKNLISIDDKYGEILIL